MAGDIDRDRQIEAQLRRTLRAGDASPALGSGPCLEPEQFAAWVDGSLSADDARAVEVHLSRCARCQAMAAAFAATDAEPRAETAQSPARVSATVVPITAKRPIRWMLPIAAGTIAATMLVWFGTRNNQPQPEAEIALARNIAEQLKATPSPVAPADAAANPQAQLSELRESRQDKAPAQARGGVSPAEARKEVRTEPPPASPPPPPPPAPAASPVPPPAQPASRSTVNSQLAAIAMPPPPPATVSGLPQNSINITIDGVRNQADLRRSSETFFPVAGVIAEFASPSSRQDKAEAASVAAQSAGVAGAAGGAGRGGGGRGGETFRAGTAETRGSIEGTARDTSGGALPGASILAKEVSTGATSAAVADNTGSFRFPSLAPGRYSLTATLPGFVQQVVDNVVVENGRASRVDLPLALGALTETVTVNRAGGGGGAGGRGGAPARDVSAKSAELVASSVTRWRIHSDNRVERSRDAGLNWQPALIDVGLSPIITGVAPSTTVCWLIGREGLVLVTSDALTFRRAATPANVDLLSVQATDALNATVTAADGRKFTTADGGRTWK